MVLAFQKIAQSIGPLKLGESTLRLGKIIGQDQKSHFIIITFLSKNGNKSDYHNSAV